MVGLVRAGGRLVFLHGQDDLAPGGPEPGRQAARTGEELYRADRHRASMARQPERMGQTSHIGRRRQTVRAKSKRPQAKYRTCRFGARFRATAQRVVSLAARAGEGSPQRWTLLLPQPQRAPNGAAAACMAIPVGTVSPGCSFF